MLLGVIFSVIVSVLFSVYAVPRKFSRQHPVLYTMYAGLAYLSGSILWCAAVWGWQIYPPENLFSPWHLLSALRGFVWTSGIACFNLAIDKIGLSKFNQWKNLQGPIGSILMLTILNDVAGAKIVFLVLGIITLLISALLFTIKTVEDTPTTIAGVLLAVFSAFCFGFTAFIQKLLTTKGLVFSQLLWHSAFVVISAAAIYLLQTRRPKELICLAPETRLPLMSGALFLAATILGGLAYTRIAGSVAFSITQLNAVWTILLGIFIFKEISFPKHWLRITAGFVSALGAIVLLLFAL